MNHLLWSSSLLEGSMMQHRAVLFVGSDTGGTRLVKAGTI